MSPSASATSPIRISPLRPSQCGRSHVTLGSPCPLTRRPSAWRSRGSQAKAAWVDYSITSSTTIARRQGNKLPAAAGEECIAGDEEGIGALAHKTGKGRIDLAVVRSLESPAHGGAGRSRPFAEGPDPPLTPADDHIGSPANDTRL